MDVYTYVYIASIVSLPPAPPLYVITEHQAGLRVLHRPSH